MPPVHFFSSDVEAELHPITAQKNIEGVELTP